MWELERSVENSLVRACIKHDLMIVKMQGGALPDRLIVLSDERVVWVEVKRPGGVPRPNQAAKIQKLRSKGQQVYVIDNRKDAIALAKALSEKDGKVDKKNKN